MGSGMVCEDNRRCSKDASMATESGKTIGRLTHLSSAPDIPSAFANSEPHAAAL